MSFIHKNYTPQFKTIDCYYDSDDKITTDPELVKLIKESPLYKSMEKYVENLALGKSLEKDIEVEK